MRAGKTKSNDSFRFFTCSFFMNWENSPFSNYIYKKMDRCGWICRFFELVMG